MDRGVWKHLPVFFVAATVCLSFYALKRVMNSTPTKSQSEELNYEMPRPQSAEAEYDLSGRQIVRNIHEISDTKKVPVKKLDPVVAAAQAQEKARMDAKKKAAEQAAAALKKKTQAAKLAAQKKMAQKKQAEMQKRMAEYAEALNRQKNQAKYDSSNESPVAPVYSSAPVYDAVPAAAAQAVNDDLRMSAAQWRSRLTAAPTVQNGTDFVAAFQKNLVEKSAFYQISEELLTDNAADRQKLAIFILRRVPSEESFTLFVKHYEAKQLEPVKAQMDAVLADYGTPARFPILTKLLYSSSARVVSKAQQVLSKTLSAQNTTQQQTQGRDARSPGSTTPIPASQFQSFIPALERLVGSNDQTVAQQAQTLIDSIKALPPV